MKPVQTLVEISNFRSKYSITFGVFLLGFASIFLLFANTFRASAWDAGPEQCKHSECSGGALRGTITNAIPAPIHCMRDIFGIPDPICLIEHNVARVAPKRAVPIRGNTHLWIVNRAIKLLGTSGDPEAKKIAKFMEDTTCRARWETGLWDMDDGDFADSPTEASFGSHFYNATVAQGQGRDVFGKATDVLTYSFAGTTGPATAKMKAIENINQYFADNFDCKWVGRSLHYMTDITQPMHSGTFSAGGSPLLLHPIFESFVPVVQAGTLPNDPLPDLTPYRGLVAADFLDVISADMNVRFGPRLMAQLSSSEVCELNDGSAVPYSGPCFTQNRESGLDALIQEILQRASLYTALYLYDVLNGAVP